ncbi:MAG: GNAT family N-acetyltransferase [Pseudomonadota bacterium]
MASITIDQAPQYRIRAARADEVEAMQRIDIASSELFRDTGLIDFGAGDGPLEAIPETRLRQGLGEMLVWVAADEADAAVGFALCADRGDDLYLDQISVMPDHGRRGLGARLTRRVIQEAETRSYKRVSLSTFRKVPWNGPFYKKLGFKEIPHWRLNDWQLAIELAQRETMDVKLRCFMQRPVSRHRRFV